LNEDSQAKKPIKKTHYDISEMEKDIDRILEKKYNTQPQKDTLTKENNNQNTFNQTASNTEEKSFPQSDTTKDSLYFIKKKEQQEEENKEKSASDWINEQFKKINTSPKEKPKNVKLEHKPIPKKVDDFFQGDLQSTDLSKNKNNTTIDNKDTSKQKEGVTTSIKKNPHKNKTKILNIFSKTTKKTEAKSAEKIQTSDIVKKENNLESTPQFHQEITKNNTLGKQQISSNTINIDDITPDGQIEFLQEAQQLKSEVIQKLGFLDTKWEELDFYALQEPFAYVEIIREKETLEKRYVLIEISLNQEEEKILKFIKETIKNFSFNMDDLESKTEKKYLIDEINQIISDYNVVINEKTKNRIIYFLQKEFLGLDRIDAMMKDPQIEDISCDGAGVSFFVYHRRFGSLKSNITFHDEEKLSNFVIKLAQKCGKHISIAEPMLDATMPDGSRLQATLGTEVTTKGSTFTIRKFKEDPFSPPDLIEFNTMSSEMVAYLWLAVENGINALVAGGTAAGKTSTLNAFSLFIPQESKIISIEETREINLPHPNWIPGVSRSGFGEVVGGKVVGEIDLYDLMKAALRQRPEYILVGEIRGREAYVLFQAMATGHTTYSTIHADSASSLIHRLEGKPINIPRIMIQSLDIVCIQVISRIKNKRARRCKQIIEIIDIDPTTKEILTNEVFKWDPVEDKFIYNGKSYILERIRADKDLSREKMVKEVKQRTELLEWMNTNNVRDFRKVSTLIARYTENPDQVIKKIKEGETK
jgi:type IV secretory pathway ATPase VirB11/archaellum biosynthesis ATPase